MKACKYLNLSNALFPNSLGVFTSCSTTYPIKQQLFLSFNTSAMYGLEAIDYDNSTVLLG